MQTFSSLLLSLSLSFSLCFSLCFSELPSLCLSFSLSLFFFSEWSLCSLENTRVRVQVHQVRHARTQEHVRYKSSYQRKRERNRTKLPPRWLPSPLRYLRRTDRIRFTQGKTAKALLSMESVGILPVVLLKFVPLLVFFVVFVSVFLLFVLVSMLVSVYHKKRAKIWLQNVHISQENDRNDFLFMSLFTSAAPWSLTALFLVFNTSFFYFFSRCSSF